MLAIVAGILVARHLKTTDDLFDSRSSPRTESLVAAAVQWAERIMRKIDSVYSRPVGNASDRKISPQLGILTGLLLSSEKMS